MSYSNNLQVYFLGVTLREKLRVRLFTPTFLKKAKKAFFKKSSAAILNAKPQYVKTYIMKNFLKIIILLLTFNFTFSQETDPAFLAQKATFNRQEKDKKMALERVKNSGTFDLENQFSQSRLLLHQDLYKQLIEISQKQIAFLENNAILMQNQEYQTKLQTFKSELEYYKSESIKANAFQPYVNPNVVADINPYYKDDGFRYEQVFEQIKQEKTDLAFFLADFKKRISQCSSKMCWDCKGTGKVKEKSGTKTIRGTNDVWAAQSRIVNTSTGNVTTSYGFNKVSTATEIYNYIDVGCKKCAATGKCASSSCIEYNKYRVAINKYFPDLCVD